MSRASTQHFKWEHRLTDRRLMSAAGYCAYCATSCTGVAWTGQAPCAKGRWRCAEYWLSACPSSCWGVVRRCASQLSGRRGLCLALPNRPRLRSRVPFYYYHHHHHHQSTSLLLGCVRCSCSCCLRCLSLSSTDFCLCVDLVSLYFRPVSLHLNHHGRCVFLLACGGGWYVR